MAHAWEAEAGEVVAWSYELATLINQTTGERSGWRGYIQASRPHVPADAIRKLRPLYAGAEVDYAQRTG